MRELVLVSYNVRRCIGLDRRHDPERVASVIRELEPDVVALQELSTRKPGGDSIDQVAFLAQATGLAPIPGPIVRHARGSFGNALLTRWEAETIEHVDLSVAPGREPRAALDVTLRAGPARLRVIGTHLGLGMRERRRQLGRLAERIETADAIPLVVMGDMNEWGPAWVGPSRLDALLGRAPRVRTFPARRPLLALDRIWVRPRAALTEVSAHRSALSRVASDHLPLRAVLRWPAHPTEAPASRGPERLVG